MESVHRLIGISDNAQGWGVIQHGVWSQDQGQPWPAIFDSADAV